MKNPNLNSLKKVRKTKLRWDWKTGSLIMTNYNTKYMVKESGIPDQILFCLWGFMSLFVKSNDKTSKISKDYNISLNEDMFKTENLLEIFKPKKLN